MKHISENIEDTYKVAKDFLDSIESKKKAVVVALKGDLGSGKTAFTQEVGKILRVSDRIQSPTFVIQKVYDIDYKGFKRLIHIDAYRLDKDSELLHLGWEEIIKKSENLVLIEWPERVSGVIPTDAVQIDFKFIDENTREITYVQE